MVDTVSRDFAAVLETLDAASVALTLCEVAANVELVGPTLDGVAALLVTSGTLYLQVGDHRMTVPAGHVALVPLPKPMLISARRTPCRMRLDSRACLRKRGRWLVADAAAGRRPTLSVAMVRIAGARDSDLDEPIALPLTACESGAQLFDLLKAQMGSADPGAPALALSLVSACLVQACRKHHVAGATVSAPRAKAGASLARALAAVRERPGDDHRAETLAVIAGMSRSTFIRQMAQFARVTPREYVQHIRLEEAAALLRTTERPIKAIAADLAFRSRSHFSRVFKAHFGFDPTRYRAQTHD